MRDQRWMKKTAAMLLAGALVCGTAAWTGAGFVKEVQAAAAPVINMDQPGTLTISKYDKDHQNFDKPLEGAGYTIYKVMSLTEDQGKYTYAPTDAFKEVMKNVEVDALGQYSAQQIEALAKELAAAAAKASPAAEEKFTDGQGKAEFTNLELGYYLVVETTVPEGYMVTGNPFLVALPQTNEQGNGWEYSVTAKPKNQNVSIDKVIDKDKQEDGLSQDGTVAVNDFVPYKITTKIPNYNNPIFEGSNVKFTITDVMSDGLRAVNDTSHPVKVTVGGQGAVKDLDYTLTVAEAAGNDPDLTVDFVSDFLKAQSGKDVVLTYYAQVTEKAVTGMVGNTNKPYLEYTNKPGQNNGHTEGPEEVKVYTFNMNVVKFTQEEGQQPTALQGAEFELHKDSPDGALVGEKITTDAHGKLSFSKLDAGLYYLVETKAPNGYTLLANPIKVEIIAKDTNTDGLADDGGFTLRINDTEISATEGGFVSQTNQQSGDAVIAVENHKGFNIPSTGGMGIVLFLAVGITGIAVVSILLTRKSKDAK